MIIVMIVKLAEGYGFTGGAPGHTGFKTVAACERAIPAIRPVYGEGNVKQIRCISPGAD